RVAVKETIRFLKKTSKPLGVLFVIHPKDTDQLIRYGNVLGEVQHPQHPLKMRSSAPDSSFSREPSQSIAYTPSALQQDFNQNSKETCAPALLNFGVLYEVPMKLTLGEVMQWSKDLEEEMIQREPINDEIGILDDEVLQPAEITPIEDVPTGILPTDDKYELDMNKVRSAQETDPEWLDRIARLKYGIIPPNLTKRAIHALLCTINDYVLDPKNQVLYRLWNKSQQRGSSLIIQQLCLPDEFHDPVIASAHKNGHFGALKVFLQIRETYYWKSMFADIKKLLGACTVCHYANSKSARKAPLNPAPIPKGPLVDVHLDLLRMSTTSNGYDYVAVMICAFSRMARCVAIKRKTAENTANAFYHGWLSVYGAPETLSITTDNGKEYTAAIFQCLVKAYGIKSKFTNYYTPNANGICERLNRTILSVLRRLTDNHPKDWSLHLDSCTNAVNSTVSTSTGVSPFELVHGMKMRLPYQIIPPEGMIDSPINEKEAVDIWRDRLTTLRKEAVFLMTAAQNEQKRQYDTKTSETTLQVGDVCARVVERLPVDGSKMAHRYEGVYEIRRFTSPTNVELYDVEKQVMHPRFLHVNKLRQIHPGRKGPEQYDGLDITKVNTVTGTKLNPIAKIQYVSPPQIADTLRRVTRSQTLAKQVETYIPPVDPVPDSIDERRITERNIALKTAQSQHDEMLEPVLSTPQKNTYLTMPMPSTVAKILKSARFSAPLQRLLDPSFSSTCKASPTPKKLGIDRKYLQEHNCLDGEQGVNTPHSSTEKNSPTIDPPRHNKRNLSKTSQKRRTSDAINIPRRDIMEDDAVPSTSTAVHEVSGTQEAFATQSDQVNSESFSAERCEDPPMKSILKRNLHDLSRHRIVTRSVGRDMTGTPTHKHIRFEDMSEGENSDDLSETEQGTSKDHTIPLVAIKNKENESFFDIKRIIQTRQRTNLEPEYRV
ncbi:MAG: hypothetical protein DRI32_08480, partial [Chloroflexi bacterium]